MKAEHEERLQAIEDRAKDNFYKYMRDDILWLIACLREAEAEAAELDADWEYARERCTDRCSYPMPEGKGKSNET